MEIVETIAIEQDVCRSSVFAKSDSEMESMKEQMKLFRIGLTKNLGKAIICGPTDVEMR